MELKKENRDNTKANFLVLTAYLYDNFYFINLYICLLSNYRNFLMLR